MYFLSNKTSNEYISRREVASTFYFFWKMLWCSMFFKKVYITLCHMQNSTQYAGPWCQIQSGKSSKWGHVHINIVTIKRVERMPTFSDVFVGLQSRLTSKDLGPKQRANLCLFLSVSWLKSWGPDEPHGRLLQHVWWESFCPCHHVHLSGGWPTFHEAVPC